MPKLIVLSEPLKDKVFDLAAERISVGRLPGNVVQLEDGAVSSHHAELIRKGEDYILKDLNSTNGTRVNGQRILETRLYHGDTVHFGHLEVQYLSSTKAAPKPLPTSNKKTVDLSATQKTQIPRPPTSYRSASPFGRKKHGKSKNYLQVALIVLGVIAAILLAIVIIQLIGSTA
ncbi:MAG: FHA domain-containing protein [Verrucomicrobiae bacterium]|nr:FHA domain-containing protein [Verrucomicrobiae bacterium]